MDFKTTMESFAEAWMAAAVSANGNLFSAANGIQSQPLALTSSPVNSSLRNSTPTTDSPNNISGKTVAIRCVIESVNSVRNWDPNEYINSHKNNNIGGHFVEIDRRVNIPVHTVFHNLLESVLHVFGYPKETIALSSGSVIIENWRPIPLAKLAQNPQKTVYDILGQISSFITLRVQILRNSGYSGSSLSQMKEKLLQLLILQNREQIINSGCPLDQVTLKSILRGSDYGTPSLSEESIRKFDQWVANQYRHILRPIPYPSPLTQFPYHLGPPPNLSHEKSSLSHSEERVHPALQTVHSQYPTQKTRMRTSFDPELELPKLQKWFTDNQHPSRQQIQMYVNELNNLDSRRGRKPLDINNVVYWFKNARAAQKRAEVRNIAPGMLHSLNGYRSGSHSPCDTAITSKGSPGSVVHSSDADEEEEDDLMMEEDDSTTEERPPLPESPIAPLQLTTYNNHNNNNTTTNNNNNEKNGNTKEHLQHEDKKYASDTKNSFSLMKRMKEELEDDKVHHSPENNESHKIAEEEKSETNEDQDRPESEYDEEMEDDVSETDSTQKGSSPDKDERGLPPIFPNSSPLSAMMPRSSIPPSAFPLVPNSMFSQSFMYMSQYIPNLGGLARNPLHNVSSTAHTQQTPNHSSSSSYSDDRRKRNRTFIDPVTEVPCLEKWFCMNTHPSHGLILQYTEDLNSMPYRQKFPRLEPKNVQFWFKNRRAKCKRLKTSLYENNLSPHDQYHQLAAALSAENYRNQD